MKVWLGSFVVLFALAELWQWVRGMAVPFPVFVVAGTLLAIATNWDKRAAAPFSWWQDPDPKGERSPVTTHTAGDRPDAAIHPGNGPSNTAAIPAPAPTTIPLPQQPAIAPSATPPLAMPTADPVAIAPLGPPAPLESLRRDGRSDQPEPAQPGKSRLGESRTSDRPNPTPQRPPIPSSPPPVQRRSPVLPVLPPRRTPPAA